MSDNNRVNFDFDHHTADYASHFAETLDHMRAKCPVAWSSAYGGFWIVTEHDKVTQALVDPQTFSSLNDVEHSGKAGGGIMIPPLMDRLTLNESDGPLHQKLRSLEAPFFTPKYLQKWTPVAQKHVDEAIDAVIETGHVDFVKDIGLPVPARTTMYVVGIDDKDWRDWALPAHKVVYTPASSPDYPRQELQNLGMRLLELLQERRRSPRDDVISALGRAQVDGKPLEDMTAAGLLLTLVTGGFDTATATIGNILYWLDQHPEAHAQLLASDAAMDHAVDEFLRVFPPAHGMARTLTKDVTLDGETLRAGERVYLSYVAANHDPKKFDCPFEVRLDRSNARDHRTFGHGVHRCLGAPLARMELRLTLAAILRRMPDFKVDRERSTRFPEAGVVNGWLTMPATFTPRRRLT